ncbi:MAG: hypothetical protein KDA73_10070 [Rhodobacteraceae bacterium]|nr:hypothetical protein [Paracoccaceae bacterium]
MKQVWAIVCVVGFVVFCTYGYTALAGLLGDRPTSIADFVLCLVGLGAGLIGWYRVMHYAPKMHGRRASARARLEEEFSDSTS